MWYCEKISNTSMNVLFPQLSVCFDTAVHSGSWSTSLPESLEACANWREGVWPLTSVHWLIAPQYVPLCERACACVSLYTIPLYTILFPTLQPSHRKRVPLWIIMCFSSRAAPFQTTVSCKKDAGTRKHTKREIKHVNPANKNEYVLF